MPPQSAVAIASICLPDYNRLGEITYPVWQRYCQRHGYQLLVVQQPLSGRGPAWDKIILLKEQLPNYDLVLWVGCDTLVTNLATKIEDWAEQFPDASLILAADVFGLNSDVMLFSNTYWSQMLLYALHEHGYHAYHNHPWAEQEALIRFVHQAPYRDHVAIVPQKGFNCPHEGEEIRRLMRQFSWRKRRSSKSAQLRQMGPALPDRKSHRSFYAVGLRIAKRPRCW